MSLMTLFITLHRCQPNNRIQTYPNRHLSPKTLSVYLFFASTTMAANLPFRNLLSLMQSRFLTTLATKNSSTSQLLSSSFTVNYLMNSCGLPLESALLTSQKLKLVENNLQRP